MVLMWSISWRSVETDIPTRRFCCALGCLDVKQHAVLLASNTTSVHWVALFNYRNTKWSPLPPNTWVLKEALLNCMLYVILYPQWTRIPCFLERTREMLDSPHITLASEPLYTDFSAMKILLLILKHLHWLSILLRSSSEVHSLLQVLL